METIHELAQLRKELAEIKGIMNVTLEEFQARPFWQQLQTSRAGVEEAIRIAEDKVRADALEAYQADPKNKKQPGVQIKLFKVANITDEAKARQWCITNFTPALKLDTKTFEKAVKDGTVPAELATITEEPRAQIDADLSGLLPQE
jgi:hypothetical protein